MEHEFQRRILRSLPRIYAREPRACYHRGCRYPGTPSRHPGKMISCWCQPRILIYHGLIMGYYGGSLQVVIIYYLIDIPQFNSLGLTLVDLVNHNMSYLWLNSPFLVDEVLGVQPMTWNWIESPKFQCFDTWKNILEPCRCSSSLLVRSMFLLSRSRLVQIYQNIHRLITTVVIFQWLDPHVYCLSHC
jgi:hypothetical protein